MHCGFHSLIWMCNWIKRIELFYYKRLVHGAYYFDGSTALVLYVTTFSYGLYVVYVNLLFAFNLSASAPSWVERRKELRRNKMWGSLKWNLSIALLANSSSHRWWCDCVSDWPPFNHELCDRMSLEQMDGNSTMWLNTCTWIADPVRTEPMNKLSFSSLMPNCWPLTHCVIVKGKLWPLYQHQEKTCWCAHERRLHVVW